MYETTLLKGMGRSSADLIIFRNTGIYETKSKRNHWWLTINHSEITILIYWKLKREVYNDLYSGKLEVETSV